ncbi:glycerophosphodiester phosphodiesterase [Haloarculaceae archaeon H-GB2-1]|nr:glycerophosphodiester phosphodiesterase [Haloarculaceae archaeon H-GB1-1]MEA5389458.1 glycerophosphodiester phosphodiesterase [Haloarculaceae archaeon H-GB11]MEA5410092.1 glycerophosphodiester phosphodiesterase [Haloarculaceae archaeon H-GB2-1]
MMEIIGHRGCAGQCPENTVTAVKRASKYVDAVEVDVRRCGSGELVVFHDETVDRLTDGSGLVSELTWSELQSLEVMDSGESIPHLDDVLDAFPSDVRAQLELKDEDVAADLERIVTGYDLDVAVSSFEPRALRQVNEREWAVETGYLFETDPMEGLQSAVELGCHNVHPHYDLCLETDIVDAAHDRDLGVIAWKAARTEQEIAELQAAGVDGVTADRWDIA